MGRITEVIARLQKALNLLENSPDKEASLIIAKRVLEETKKYDDFSMAADRRQRIARFLKDLSGLEEKQPAEGQKSSAKGFVKQVLEELEVRHSATEDFNLFEKVLTKHYGGKLFWDSAVGACYDPVARSEDHPGSKSGFRRTLSEGSYQLIDLLAYYEDHALRVRDLEPIERALKLAIEDLDLTFGKEFVYLASAIFKVKCFLGSHNIGTTESGELVREYHPRIMSYEHSGKYGDEWKVEALESHSDML